MSWKAVARRDFLDDGVVLLARRSAADGRLYKLVDLKMEAANEWEADLSLGFVPPAEAADFLQAMMDAAYEIGLRPSRAQDERHLKEHLKDMQEITRHVLGIGSASQSKPEADQ